MPATNGVPRRSYEVSPLNLVYRALLFAFVAAVVLFEFPGAQEHRRSPDPGVDTQNLVILAVDPSGPNAGADIQPGDVIYAIDGQRLRNHIHYLSVLSGNQSQSPQSYTLVRGGAQVEVAIQYRSKRLTFRDVAFPLVAFIFIVVGLWVYLRRPDTLGTLFAANCAILASFLTHRPSPTLPSLQLAGELLYDAVLLLFPALLLHFFLLFPDRVRSHSRRRMWLVVLYAPPAVLITTSAYLATQRFRLQSVAESLVSALLAVSVLYFSAYVVVSLVTFVRHYRSAGRAQKQKLRVVIAGALAGFLPFLALFVYRSMLPGQSSSLESAAAVCLAFVPATFAYSILKHGAIELNAVVRKGLVYAVLSAGVIAAYYVVVHFLGEVLIEELGVSSAVLMPVAALVLALVFAPARSHIQRLVDRLFYREEYIYKQEVFEFNRQLARQHSKEEIYTHFSDRASSLLRSSYIALYIAHDDGDLKLKKVTGVPPQLPDTFPLECFLGRYFSRYKTPLMAEYLDRSWERPNLDAASREFLAVESLGVCVPVVAPDHFAGLVLLGEKLSGATYRRADAELLETFAEQLALVLQNVDLVQSSLEQERLKSEVMLAREIQLSLLPSEPPRLGAFELSGRMASCMEVGGDYFDYFAVDDEHVGIAVGDVSGKGIPAAMLMSSIQAVFKNLAQKSRLGPSAVNQELNDHVFQTAKPDQFATFFYGVFDVSSSTFTFSNGGHCPALLVKPGYVDRLSKGGMVLGIERGQRFLEGTVRMEPGDVMLLYTDGLTEQENDQGVDYGEDRLIEFLLANRNLPLEALQDALLEDLNAFGGGRQDDDTTIVIVRHRTD